jgi:hypothetical protein
VLAYERLPGRVKTEMNELEVFNAFTIAAGLHVDKDSARNANRQGRIFSAPSPVWPKHLKTTNRLAVHSVRWSPSTS